MDIQLKNSLICDISNIACYNKRKAKPKLAYIDLVFEAIPLDFELIAIADNSLYHQIDAPTKYKQNYLRKKKIIEAPAGIPADVFILKCAKLDDAFIISNDKFREYSEYSDKWLMNHRLSFMIINNHLFFSTNLPEIGELRINNSESDTPVRNEQKMLVI